MKRPHQHEIDDRACDLLRLALPDAWVYRELPKDYGIDGEVELFRQGSSTGAFFKVQVKGTEKPSFLTDGRTISFSLSTDHVSYFCHELSAPVFLMLVDTAKQRVWWHAIQLDTDLVQRLRTARERGSETITVHIDSKNTLSDRPDVLLHRLSEMALLISFRSVSSASEASLLNTLSSVCDISSAVQGFSRGLSYARVELLQRTWSAGDKRKAKVLIAEILKDEDAPLFAKVSTLEMAELLAIQSYRRIGRQELASWVELRFAAEQKTLCRSGPTHLRIHAALKRRLALLHAAIDHDYNLYLNTKVYEETADRGMADPFWAMMLNPAREEAARGVMLRYQHCMSLLDWAATKGEFHLVAYDTVGVLSKMVNFLVRLRSEGMTQAVAFWEQRLEALASAAISIAAELEDWQLASLLINSSLHIADMRQSESLDKRMVWARKQAEQIPKHEVRKRLLDSLEEDRSTALRLLADIEDAEPSIDEEKRMIRAMAMSLGINLDDPMDEIANVVRIGLRDLDPTRVLKTCRHLFLTLGSRGIPAVMLGLPTAGSKTLWCTLHNHGIGGMVLDRLHKSMLNEHCSNCIDRDPHPEGWTWTRAWQAKQHERFGNRFRGL
jgi:hypothetical protein